MVCLFYNMLVLDLFTRCSVYSFKEKTLELRAYEIVPDYLLLKYINVYTNTKCIMLIGVYDLQKNKNKNLL